MNFADRIAEYAEHVADARTADDTRIRAQARTRAIRRGVTDAQVIAAFQDRAAVERSHSDPEPALQAAWMAIVDDETRRAA